METLERKWWIELLNQAKERGEGVYEVVSKSKLFYLSEYYDREITPADALEEEWG